MDWALSVDAAPQSDAPACPAGYEFAAPHTALEQSVLDEAMRNASVSEVWIRMRADTPGCWDGLCFTLAAAQETCAPICRRAESAAAGRAPGSLTLVAAALLSLLPLLF
jgi:hypothetical protein